MIISEKPERKTHVYTDAELKMIMGGQYIDPDAELVKKQHEEAENGIIKAYITSNIYGYCLFQPYNGGRRISENFKLKKDAKEYALKWEKEDPKKHHYIMWRND